MKTQKIALDRGLVHCRDVALQVGRFAHLAVWTQFLFFGYTVQSDQKQSIVAGRSEVMQEVNESTPIAFSSEGLQTIPLRLGNIQTNKSIIHGGLLIAVALLMLVEPQQLMTFFVTEIASRYLFILGGSIALTLVAFVERWTWLIFVGMTLFSVAVASQYVVVTSGAALTIALTESCFLFFLLMRVWFQKHLHWAVVCTILGGICSLLIFGMKYEVIPTMLILPSLLVVIAVMFIIDLRRR